MIEYTDSTDGVTPEMLRGFFIGWTRPHDAETHLTILRNSNVTMLAVDPEAGRVVGFVVAMTDHVQQAFIYILEVLPAYQRQGIGTELVKRILEKLQDVPCIDLTCDPALQPFYSRFGMQPSVGMVVRDY